MKSNAQRCHDWQSFPCFPSARTCKAKPYFLSSDSSTCVCATAMDGINRAQCFHDICWTIARECALTYDSFPSNIMTTCTKDYESE
eukprot:6191159-Amphidinium_carterae.1